MAKYLAVARGTVLPLNCRLGARFARDRNKLVLIPPNISQCEHLVSNSTGIGTRSSTWTGISALGPQQSVPFHREEGEDEPQCQAHKQSGTRSMADLLDLETQFAFYGAYHQNTVNVLIHCVWVWPLFLTALILPAFTPELVALPLPAGLIPGQQFAVLNWSFVVAAVYALYYVALDKRAGSLGAALCFACWIASNAIAQTLGFALAWKVALLSQLLGWIFQFLGHGLFERRAPALLDNLAQALLMAPFFVLLEILQSLGGYEPNPGFRERVSKKVHSDIAKYRALKRA